MDVLGNEFVSKDGTVDGSALNGKVVGLYFSAHWCPPCRGFTPKLVEFYNLMKTTAESKGAQSEFEIIFVSSDQDQEQFEGYYAEMPWLALPFANRDLKNKLSKNFKVKGIPMFVILDKDGSVITTDGRTEVTKDPEATNFPWKPKPVGELLGSEFVNGKGETFGKEAIDGKYLGIYFSAHWCPPCRGFTPELAKLYNKLKEMGKPFEIIFCSSDRDQSSFDEYLAEMPWLALPFSKRDEKGDLSSRFDVEGIPTFVIVDDTPERKLVNASARSAVSQDPEGASFPWVPAPLKILPDGVDDINEEACFIALLEQCDDDDQEDAIKVLNAVAAEFKEKGDDLVFMCAKGGDPISPQIRKLTSIKPKPTAQLLILDIPDDGGFHEPVDEITNITEDVVRKFVADYKAKATTRKQLNK